MGKKSKRKKSGGGGGGGGGGGTGTTDAAASTAAAASATCVTDEEQLRSPTAAPAKRKSPKNGDDDEPLEETLENLRFEDPFEDEFEEEDVVQDGDGDDDEDEEEEQTPKVRSWTPFAADAGGDEELEMDESAYAMHHAIAPEWPSLSFCFLPDDLGDHRTRFPHTLTCAVGTQADRPDRNRLTVIRLSDLDRTRKGGDDDPDDDPDDSDDDDDSAAAAEVDPVMEHVSFPHKGGVNRVRAMPQAPHVVATWSDAGTVYLYDVRTALDTFRRSAGEKVSGGNGNNTSKRPFFTYQGHVTEGYAMDWSTVEKGLFATGDCAGSIHLWRPSSATSSKDRCWSNDPSTSSFSVVKDAYPGSKNASVEDIQWSPTEPTVLASAHAGGDLRIHDTRKRGAAMLARPVGGGVDVNAAAWNRRVTNLLACGADDGVVTVHDLRTFSSNSSSDAEPLARLSSHRTPVNALEWHPHDESVLLASDDAGVYVYDLSVEADDDDDDQQQEQEQELPPQLLFAHAGSKMVKECHWHPQIPSLVMSTALDGYSVFVPSNM